MSQPTDHPHPRITRDSARRAYYNGKLLPDGPWHTESEHEEFRSPSGRPCMIHRNDMGAWCGYVAVAPDHPWHGVEYGQIDPFPDVHGGLTYSSKCQGPLCHVPLPGESDDVWWLGFDCIHSGDLSLYDVANKGGASVAATWIPPGLGEWHATYKTAEYARRETLSLAEQADARAP